MQPKKIAACIDLGFDLKITWLEDLFSIIFATRILDLATLQIALKIKKTENFSNFRNTWILCTVYIED